MSGVRRYVLFSAMDRYATQVFFVATAATMARLLTPAETGLFLIVNALIMLADNFRTFGVGVYIVQAPDLRREMVRSAFTVTLLLSVAIAAAIFSGADVIAGFYGEPAIAHLLRLAAFGFLAIPFGAPIMALMQRDLSFRSLAVINIASAAVGAVTTISLGVAGLGASSYVWGFIAQGIAIALTAFAMRPELWPYRPCFRDIRAVLSFGSITSMTTVINMISDMIPRLAFGKLLGMEAVGLYGRAVTICQMPDRLVVSALTPVVLPAMAARLRRGEGLKPAYLRGYAVMSAVQWPTFVMLALLADPVVALLLGNQWGEVAPLLRLMAVANMALAPAFMTFPVLVSIGRVRETLFASLISLPPSMALVIAASTISLDMVAASLLVAAPLQMAVALFFVRRAIGMTWSEFAAASRQSLPPTLAIAAVPCAIIALSPHGFDLGWLETSLAVAGAAPAWLAAIWVFNHPLKSEIAAVLRMALCALPRPRIRAATHPH